MEEKRVQNFCEDYKNIYKFDQISISSKFFEYLDYDGNTRIIK